MITNSKLVVVIIIRYMVPLFSKIDSNKLWHDEVTLICAKFGKDMFNIFKVIGRKTKWPRFWPTLQQIATQIVHDKLRNVIIYSVLRFSVFILI